MASQRDDPVLSHSRREAVVIGLTWLVATVVTCGLSYVLGYQRPGRPLGPEDVRPVWGIPFWFLVGVLVPWATCLVWTWYFVLRHMAEDDLGSDHAAELEGDIRREAGGDA
ncbi:MAG: hypothetical protein KatS3mg108_1704 [Isosphaeraceae bacterium]|jgi:hypothetical protein|nr:MAG: hypothetical protein KatS3mg108_1704 [Isosphaeraceae bacterium]